METEKIRKRLPLDSRDWYSESEAAKNVGVQNSKKFYKCFVLTGQIDPIIFPGQKQRKYLKTEVEGLLEKNKRPVIQEEEPEYESDRDIFHRLKRERESRGKYARSY